MTDTAAIPATNFQAPRFEAQFRRAIRVAILLIVSVLSIAVGIVALGSGLGVIPLPFEMVQIAERVPIIFRAHMLVSALALLLIPAVLLTRHRAELHRPLGRLLGAFVVIGGLTALPVAVLSHSSLAARAGFFVQGVVWLALLTGAWRAIRQRQIQRHVVLMLAMVAVTTGAVWFRLFIGTAIALRLPFEPAYAIASWAGWVLPLALVAVYRGPLARIFMARPRAAVALAQSPPLV